jgi:quercetin dioxygenase-like cupin family protein
MINHHSDETFRELLPGIRMKTLVHGDKTLMVEFHLDAGAELPRHAHPYEQTGYLTSGAMRLSIGDTIHEVGPGDSWCIPADIEHSAEVIEATVAVEVFSPVREDYLPVNAEKA